MYTRHRPWPTCRRIGGGRIFVWTRLPLLIPSLSFHLRAGPTRHGLLQSLAASPSCPLPSRPVRRVCCSLQQAPYRRRAASSLCRLGICCPQPSSVERVVLARVSVRDSPARRGLGWSRVRQGSHGRWLLDGDGRRASYLIDIGSISVVAKQRANFKSRVVEWMSSGELDESRRRQKFGSLAMETTD
jgi:hypothetical protein